MQFVVRFILAALLALPAVSWLGDAAQAQTRVSRDGRVITISVYLNIHMPAYLDRASGTYVDGPGRPIRLVDPISGERVDVDTFGKSVRQLADQAAALWNDAFARLPLRCYRLRLEVDMGLLGVNYWNSAGDDDILDFVSKFVHPGHMVSYCGRDEDCWVEWRYGIPDPNLVYDPTGAPTEDTTAPYELLHLAHFTFPMEPYELGHEIGHFMGLGDDVEVGEEDGEEVKQPKSGREGTFMTMGPEVADVNIDQDLIDRIGRLVGQVIDLPACRIRAANTSERVALVHDGGAQGRTVYRGNVEIRAQDNERGDLNGLATLTFDQDGQITVGCGSTTTRGHATHNNVAVVGRWEGNSVRLEMPKGLKYVLHYATTGCMKAPAPHELWGAYLHRFEGTLKDFKYENEFYSWERADDYLKYEVVIEDLGPDT